MGRERTKMKHPSTGRLLWEKEDLKVAPLSWPAACSRRVRSACLLHVS